MDEQKLAAAILATLWKGGDMRWRQLAHLDPELKYLPKVLVALEKKGQIRMFLDGTITRIH